MLSILKVLLRIVKIKLVGMYTSMLHVLTYYKCFDLRALDV